MSQKNSDLVSILVTPLTFEASNCLNMKILVKLSTSGKIYVEYTNDNDTWFDDTTYGSAGVAVTTGDIIDLGDISPFTIVKVTKIAGTGLTVGFSGYYKF